MDCEPLKMATFISSQWNHWKPIKDLLNLQIFSGNNMIRFNHRLSDDTGKSLNSTFKNDWFIERSLILLLEKSTTTVFTS